jgi:hypothetical protein
MQLLPRSSSSYAIASGTPADLVRWLSAQPGIKTFRPRSPKELTRLECPGRGLFIVYRSGTLLIQGQQIAAHRIIASLVALPEQMEATI